MGPGGPGPWGAFPVAPKPGVIPLRPLNVGDIISGIFTTIRYNIGSVYGPTLFTGAGCLLLLGTFALVEWSPLHDIWVDARNHTGIDNWQPSDTEIRNAAIAFGGFFLLILLSYFAVYVSASLSSIATLRHAVVGRRVRMRQTVAETRAGVGRLIGAMLLGQLLCAAPMIAVIVVFAGLIAVTNGSGAAFGFGVLCYFGAVAASIYLQIRLVPLAATVVLEGKRPVEAIKRAWQLNEGAWWRSLGVTLLVSLIGFALQYSVQQVVSIFFVGATGFTTTTTANANDPAALRDLMTTLIAFYAIMLPVYLLLNLITTPLIPLAHGLLYIDRRIRRESLDIQLAEEAGVPFASAAPMPPQDIPPPPPGV
jgi:hypothetical protein